MSQKNSTKLDPVKVQRLLAERGKTQADLIKASGLSNATVVGALAGKSIYRKTANLLASVIEGWPVNQFLAEMLEEAS